MTADPMRTVPRVLVQTCGSLPAQESGWTTQRYVRFTSGSEGAGQFLGNAVLEQYFGTVQAPESLIYAQVGVAPDIANTGQSNGLDGQIVRILKEDDDAGTVTVAGVTYTPFWWGFIVSQSLSPDLGNGGMAVWSAVGLQGMLDQIVIRNGVVRSSDGVSLVNPGYLSEFNKLSGGDRSDSKFQMTHGMAYVHDLTSVTSGNYWSARDIVDLLLAGFTGMATVAGSQVYVIGGLKWVVSDPDGCLLYIPETINLDGETVFRSLVTLINERRGMTWWITVAANVVTINVQSTVSEAIASVGYTLPAASLTSSLDVTNDPWIVDLKINQDDSSVYDIIEITGAHPLVGLTLSTGSGFNGQLQPGWSIAAQIVWNRSTDSSLTKTVWRRFEINSTWDGSTSTPLVGLRDNLTTSTDDIYGNGGFTGDRTHRDRSVTAPAFMLETDRMLPCSTGFSTLRLDDRQSPVVIFQNISSAICEDVTAEGYNIQVNDGPPSITLDDGQNGADIATRLDVYTSMLVTIAIRESQPLRVSWVRQSLNSGVRIKSINVKDAEQWILLPFTATSVGDGYNGSTSGELLTTGSSIITIRDDLFRLRNILALARGFYESPIYTVSWTNRGELDIEDTFRPGHMLFSVISGTTTTGIYQSISRRSWSLGIRDGVEMWDTAYSVECPRIELEALI